MMNQYMKEQLTPGGASSEQNVFAQLAIEQAYASSTLDDGLTSSEDSCSEPLVSASSKKASKFRHTSEKKQN